MKNKNTVKSEKLPGIENIRYLSSNKARHIRISIKAQSGVTVTVPKGASLEKAKHFVLQKKEWIIKHQIKIYRQQQLLTQFDENTVFATREHRLITGTHENSTIKIKIRNGIISVLYPDFASIKDPRIQQAIRKAIVEAWRLEAKKILPVKIKELSDKYGFRYQEVKIRENKTRWGSCSAKNSISLNLHLIRLPEHLCNYVILHELVHTVHRNHQKQFWELLNSLTGENAKKLDKELKNFRIELW